MPEGIGYPEDEMTGEMEAGASPDAVMAADEQMAQETQATMSAGAPEPKSPFSVQAISTLVKQFNATKDAFTGKPGVLPDVEWTAPEGPKKWSQPLPPEIFAPLVAVQQAVSSVGGGEFAEKYSFDPMSIVDDPSLRQATMDLRRMEKDNKLIKALSGPVDQAAAPAPEEKAIPTSPSEMTAEDEALIESM